MSQNCIIRTTTVGLLVMGLYLGIGSQGTAATKQYLSLGTANPSGTFYFLGAGFGNIFNKYVPEARVIAESTAGGEENFHLLLRKKMDMGLAGIHVIEFAMEKKMDMSGMRLISLGHTSDRHWFVRKESPVRSISDFKGRRVAVGSPGSATLGASKAELSALSGLTFDDFKPAYLSFTETITAIKDGTIDVGMISAGYPVASLLDLARQIPIRLISYSEEEVKSLIAKQPFYVRVVIPRGTYQGGTTNTLTRGIVTALFCRRDLSENLVYQLARALYEHPKEKDAIHPQAKQWNLDNIFRGKDYTTQYIPFHPGAVKYLKQKGLWKE
jgi:TRAP transporter TAXI family solute receptor